MPLDQHTHEIVAAFQRYTRTGDEAEVDAFSLTELRLADEQLGHRDVRAAYRLAIQNRIRQLEEQDRLQQENEQEQDRRLHEEGMEQDRRRHESRVRAFQLLMTLIVGIIVGLIIAKLA